MANRIQIRRDTAANWTSVNPTLTQGELGLEINTGKLKVGDGTSAWTALPYFTVNYSDVPGAPAALSDLTNDVGYITAADIPPNELPANANGYLRNNGTGTLTWSSVNVPTSTSQLTNDSGFITVEEIPTDLTLNVLKVNSGIKEKFDTYGLSSGTEFSLPIAGFSGLYFIQQPSNNWTLNLVGFTLDVGYWATFEIVIEQGSTGYYPNGLKLDGNLYTINWKGGVPPTPSTNAIDVVKFKIINKAGTVVVLGELGAGVNTGSLSFNNTTMYNNTGVTVSNRGAITGATAFLQLPADSGPTINIQNNYGNIQLVAGQSPGTIKTWSFGETGGLTFPDNTVQTTAYVGENLEIDGGNAFTIQIAEIEVDGGGA